MKVINITSKLLMLLGSITILGCIHDIRSHTYPPEFTYVETHELASSMHQLANLVAGLNRSLVIDDSISNDTKQKLVVEILKQMEMVGSQLKGTGATNHPTIDSNIDRFRTSLENARMAAEHQPPNYYLAGTITGGCTNCHALQN